MTERINPPLPLEGVMCPRCYGNKIDPQLDAEGHAQDCKRCHGTGEPQDGHMDEGCVPVGSDYGPARGIQPPTADMSHEPDKGTNVQMP